MATIRIGAWQCSVKKFPTGRLCGSEWWVAGALETVGKKTRGAAKFRPGHRHPGAANHGNFRQADFCLRLLRSRGRRLPGRPRATHPADHRTFPPWYPLGGGGKVSVYDASQQQTSLFETPDEIHLDIDDFNRKVITESFNRVVCQRLAQELDPASRQKTLIFCVLDTHADSASQHN